MMKETLAKIIAGKMNNKQKKELLDRFYEKNKDNPQISELMASMKKTLNYKEE